MKIVFFTRQGYESNQLFRYMHARVASRYPDCEIVAVYPRTKQQSLSQRIQKSWKKMRQLGWFDSLEILSSYPLQLHFAEQHRRERDALMRCLPRPTDEICGNSARVVGTVNGPDAVQTIRSLNPDVVIQAGAGILRSQIFQIGRLGCLNLHHGIAPLIRGMNSIYWGLWENRPEWIGSTVHQIDEGIDTGKVLAYAPVQQLQPDEGFPSLFVRATELGVDRLLDVLSRLEAGERWTTPPLAGESAYRSTVSGWKLMLLAWRLRARRNVCAREPRGEASQP